MNLPKPPKLEATLSIDTVIGLLGVAGVVLLGFHNLQTQLATIQSQTTAELSQISTQLSRTSAEERLQFARLQDRVTANSVQITEIERASHSRGE